MWTTLEMCIMAFSLPPRRKSAAYIDMSESQQSGLHVFEDSGPPQGSTDYTTLVLLHGYAWHSGPSILIGK